MESVNVFIKNISALQPIENSILLNEKFKPISNKIFIGYLESIKKINCMTLYSDNNTIYIKNVNYLSTQRCKSLLSFIESTSL